MFGYISRPQILFGSIRMVIELIEVEPVLVRLLFFLRKLIELIDSNLPLYNFSLYLLTIRTIAKVLDIGRFERSPWVFHKFLLNEVHTSERWFVMLSLNHSRFILFVHALDRFSGVALEVLVTGLDWVSYVDNFLLPEIFEIHVFCPIDFLLVFMDLYFHLINKTHSDRVQKLWTEPVFHVG